MTEKITREEIEALLKLADAATPGPWKLNGFRLEQVCDSAGFIVATATSTPSIDERSLQQRAEDQAAFIAAANPAVIKALCTLALQAEAMQPRPMSEFPPLGPTVVSQVAYVTNGKHYGEAVRSHDEPRWAWTQTRHWCDPQPTHFYALTSLPEPRR